MHSTLETLGRQHHEVLDRLKSTERALPDRDALGDFHAFLSGEVLQHFALEEAALFPILERHPQMAQGPLPIMDGEHRLFRELLSLLASALRAKDGLSATRTATELINLLRAHIAKEDRVLFPMAEALLSDEEKTAVDEKAVRLGLLAEAA